MMRAFFLSVSLSVATNSAMRSSTLAIVCATLQYRVWVVHEHTGDREVHERDRVGQSDSSASRRLRHNRSGNSDTARWRSGGGEAAEPVTTRHDTVARDHRALVNAKSPRAAPREKDRSCERTSNRNRVSERFASRRASSHSTSQYSTRTVRGRSVVLWGRAPFSRTAQILRSAQNLIRSLIRPKIGQKSAKNQRDATNHVARRRTFHRHTGKSQSTKMPHTARKRGRAMAATCTHATQKQSDMAVDRETKPCGSLGVSFVLEKWRKLAK